MALKMPFDQLVSLCSMLLAGLAIVIGLIRDQRSSDRANARIGGKLDHISETLGEIKTDVRDVQRAVNDHSARLVGVETELRDHERRIGKLEEQHRTDGTE